MSGETKNQIFTGHELIVILGAIDKERRYYRDGFELTEISATEYNKRMGECGDIEAKITSLLYRKDYIHDE